MMLVNEQNTSAYYPTDANRMTRFLYSITLFNIMDGVMCVCEVTSSQLTASCIYLNFVVFFSEYNCICLDSPAQMSISLYWCALI